MSQSGRAYRSVAELVDIYALRQQHPVDDSGNPASSEIRGNVDDFLLLKVQHCHRKFHFIAAVEISRLYREAVGAVAQLLRVLNNPMLGALDLFTRACSEYIPTDFELLLCGNGGGTPTPEWLAQFEEVYGRIYGNKYTLVVYNMTADMVGSKFWSSDIDNGGERLAVVCGKTDYFGVKNASPVVI